MVKAAALYIVIIVSLLIAVISASLLTIAFYYRFEVQKKARFDRLSVNLESGTTILLSKGFTKYNEDLLVDLYGAQKDSVMLNKIRWGVFDLVSLKAFELKDTLRRSFFSAHVFDDQNAIYLADEDRPLSVSGNTQITGNGQLPKSGLKQAYVDGMPYAGKELIKGSITDSKRELPPIDEEVLQGIIKRLEPLSAEESEVFNVTDSVSNSFFNKEKVYKLFSRPATVTKGRNVAGETALAKRTMPIGSTTIAGVKLRGKVIVVADTILYISATAVLEDVQIYAPAIVIEEGFKGSCQLFARDSIIIGKQCEFYYPSFAGVFKPEDSKIQSKLEIAEGGKFEGVLFSYEKTRSDLQTIISLGKDVKVSGEVYATGYIKVERSVSVMGKVTANRFMMQTPSTLYENYLIDIVLNRKLLSKYYLSPLIFKKENKEQKILKWLN